MSSRSKGHNFERAMVNLLNQEFESAKLPITVSRNLEQTRDGGSDIVGLSNFQIECKRYRRNSTDIPQKQWWSQVCQESEKNDDVPLLIYKYDYQKDIQIQFPVMLFSFREQDVASYNEYPARMNIEDFMCLFVCYLKAIYG